MKHHKANQKGSTIVAIIVAILVLAGIAITGFVVYRHSHHSTTDTVTTTNKSTQAKHAASNASQATNLYAGWKTYCDSLYKYCFQYPNNWTLTNGANVHGVTLVSPSQIVNVSYGVPQPQSTTTELFTPLTIEKLTSKKEALTIIGGYTYNVSAKKYFPSYYVVDSSLLEQYPLSVGSPGQLPNVPSFTVLGTSGYLGSFAVAPVSSTDTLAEAKAWFTARETQTSLRILESFYYE